MSTKMVGEHAKAPTHKLNREKKIHDMNSALVFIWLWPLESTASEITAHRQMFLGAQSLLVLSDLKASQQRPRSSWKMQFSNSTISRIKESSYEWLKEDKATLPDNFYKETGVRLTKLLYPLSSTRRNWQSMSHILKQKRAMLYLLLETK